MIALIDYGAGNLTSVRKALAAVGAEFQTPRTPAELADAAGIVVPGVGHFAATAALDEGWREAMAGALDRGAALLGICLGMHWLFEGSAEAPGVRGLGVLAGCCGRLPEPSTQFPEIGPTPLWKIPHIGWNSLAFPRPSTLCAGVPPDAQVYFAHSYIAPDTPAVAAATSYGATFPAAIEQGRIAGVQFHPEKSGDVGLHILANWVRAV